MAASLQDYVNSQKKKSVNFSNLLPSTNGFNKVFGSSANEAVVKVEIPGNEVSNQDQSKPGNKYWFSHQFMTSESVFGLSRLQRTVGFACFILAGIFCFIVASFYIPVLVFKARKFAALYTLGSCCFVFSFVLLLGPYTYVSHLLSQQRLPMTAAYTVSLLATLYCSLWINSTVLTIVCAAAQVFALLWFLISYIPGGESGLRFMMNVVGRLFSKTVKGTALPV